MSLNKQDRKKIKVHDSCDKSCIFLHWALLAEFQNNVFKCWTTAKTSDIAVRLAPDVYRLCRYIIRPLNCSPFLSAINSYYEILICWICRQVAFQTFLFSIELNLLSWELIRSPGVAFQAQSRNLHMWFHPRLMLDRCNSTPAFFLFLFFPTLFGSKWQPFVFVLPNTGKPQVPGHFE